MILWHKIQKILKEKTYYFNKSRAILGIAQDMDISLRFYIHCQFDGYIKSFKHKSEEINQILKYAGSDIFMRPKRAIKVGKTIQVDRDIYELRLKTLNRLILTALKRKEAKRIKELAPITNITDANTNLN